MEATGNERHSSMSLETLGTPKSRQPPKLAQTLLISRTSARQLAPTIFHEPWWLEIVCDGSYREVTVSSGGVIVGRLPYQSSSVYGLKLLNMPLLTYVLGPVLMERGGNVPNVLKQIAIVQALIKKLPRASYVSFRLRGGGGTAALAFESAGFSNSIGSTVEIAPNQVDSLWRQMRDKTRNIIRRAQERLTVTDSLSPEDFFEFFEENLHRQNLVNVYDRLICTKVMSESLHRGVGRLLATVDPSNNLQSAIFTVWDDQMEYYLLSTRTPSSINGATSLAIWTGIQHAAQRGLTFDMAGIHVHLDRLPNIVLLTGFGGVITPRYMVKRATSVIRIAQSIKSLVNYNFGSPCN
jgi:hypothetical protein